MLSRSFEFTADELTENQHGQLSDKQKSRLREQMIGWGILSGLVVIGLSIILIGLVRGAVDFFYFILAAPLVLTTLVMIYALWTTIRDTRSDLRQGLVASITGVAEPYSKRGYRGSTINYLKIGTLDFMISPRYPAFRADTRYQIFYAPATKVILSAVRLDD